MKTSPIDKRPGELFTVYWQPGCSSCLRTKEFLKSRDIDYKSVNVREDESAMEALEKIGARSVPVVTLGEKFVYTQDLEVLAGFVGVSLSHSMLPIETLVTRIDMLLAAAQRYLSQLPLASLTKNLPGRDRDYLDLGFHIFIIPIAFLDAVHGKELTFEHFERKPPDDLQTIEKVVVFGEKVRGDMHRWWQSCAEKAIPNTVMTYYGEHATHSVLERTAWHAAQHVRQLMELVRNEGLEPDGPLGDAELAGLPLPDEIYDDEVDLEKS